MNVILRTAQQSHPLLRGRPWAHRPVTPHPARSFAAALAARYGRAAVSWQAVGAILARPPRPGGGAASSRANVHHHDHRHVTRLRLTVSPQWRQLLSAAAQASAAAGRNSAGFATQLTNLYVRSRERRAGDVLNLVLNRPRAPAAALHLEPRILQQMMARTNRISLLQEAPTPATLGAATVQRAAPPVRRLVRRAAPVETESPPVHRGREREAREAHRPVAPTEPVRLDSAEINRVTDHVLRTIDRQMWARRERTGRV